MALYTGIKSPCCNKEFNDDDDIVVCPVCGTPHHRECYAEKGNCWNLLLHENGFIWKTPIENAIHGYKVVEEMQEQSAKEPPNEEQMKNFFDVLERAGLPRDTFENPGEQFEERNIYGVSAREISSFQGIANPISLERYRKIVKSRNKISLNLFAGILFPFYQFYNRHRGAGIMLCLINFILDIPSNIAFLSAYPVLFSESSRALFENMTGFESFNILTQWLKIILSVVCCLFYDYIYLRWMTRRIMEIRSRYGDEDPPPQYYAELTAAGKPGFLRMTVDWLVVSASLSLLFLLAINMYS